MGKQYDLFSRYVAERFGVGALKGVSDVCVERKIYPIICGIEQVHSDLVRVAFTDEKVDTRYILGENLVGEVSSFHYGDFGSEGSVKREFNRIVNESSSALDSFILKKLKVLDSPNNLPFFPADMGFNKKAYSLAEANKVFLRNVYSLGADAIFELVNHNFPFSFVLSCKMVRETRQILPSNFSCQN